MHAIERELIKATGYKAQRKFSDRQDYLRSILNAINKLDNDDFDGLSDEAAFWANAAVENHNSKKDLPDFDESVPTDDEEEQIEEASAEAAGLTNDDSEEDDDSEDESDHDPETGEVIEDEDEEADPEDEPEDDEPQQELPLERKTTAKRIKEAPPAKPVKAVKKSPVKTPFAHDAVLDKWGAIEGSKNSLALALFEKGATAKEVKEKLGGTYYNILKRAVEHGHKMEKEGSLIKLTHKDAAKAKKVIPSTPKTPPKKKAKK